MKIKDIVFMADVSNIYLYRDHLDSADYFVNGCIILPLSN